MDYDYGIERGWPDVLIEFRDNPTLVEEALARSEPADRAVVAQSPAIVTLVFNEPVSPVVLRLVGPNGDVRELKEAAAENTILTVMLSQALVRGTHLLSWRVVSADGHPVGGMLSFSIGAPSAMSYDII